MNEGIGNADRENVTQSLCWSYDMWVNCFERERESAMSKNKGKGRGLEWLGYKCSSQTVQTMNEPLHLSSSPS